MAKVKTEEQETLEDFNWDQEGTSDFFGAEAVPQPPESPAEAEQEEEEEEEEAEEQDTKKKVKVKAKEEEEEEEDEAFDFDNDTEEEEEEEPGETDYEKILISMKEKGIFQHAEIEDDVEIDEDTFIELQDQEIEGRVGEALESFLEELDSDGAAFLKFKKEGGDTEDFFKVYKESTIIPKGNIEKEDFQEKLNRYYYGSVEGLDAEDIEDRIEWLKDSGKLKKFAEKHSAEIKELEIREKETLQKTAEENQKKQQKSREAFVKNVKETLDNNEKIDNLVLTPKKRRDLQSFITKPTVKVAKNKYVTSMHDKLQKVLKDPEKMFILADLLMTDFDFSNVAKAAVTEKTRTLKKSLQRTKKSRPSTSGSAKPRKNLADFF